MSGSDWVSAVVFLKEPGSAEEILESAQRLLARAGAPENAAEIGNISELAGSFSVKTEPQAIEALKDQPEVADCLPANADLFIRPIE